MELDFQECGLSAFNKQSDVLIIAPEIEVEEGISTIRVKNLRKPVILKSLGSFF